MMRVYPRVDEDGEPIGYSGKHLYTAERVFDGLMLREWFEDPIVKQMVKDVDNTEHIKGSLFESPILGDISAKELSGGVKGLILIYKCFEIPRMFSSCIFGNNCCEWLRWLSFKVDFGFYFAHGIKLYAHKPIMAQKWNAPDWNRRDFIECFDVYNYYIHGDEVVSRNGH